MTDNFAETPLSVAELRAEKFGACDAWSPRDVLIDVLRKLDRKEIGPQTLVVSWIDVKNGKEFGHFRMAGPSALYAIGLLHANIHDMLTPEG